MRWLRSGSKPKTEEKKEEKKETDPLLPSDSSTSQGPLLKSWDLGFAEWLNNLQGHFGSRLLVLLFTVQHLLKGFASAFGQQAEPYLFRAYSVPAPQMQILSGVSLLPFALKPLIGLLSDILPIQGYRKAPYMLISCAIGTVGYLVVGLVPQSHLPITWLVVCLFAVNMQISACDLLSEAKYSEKMRETPSQGPALLTYVWFGLNFFSLLAVLSSGPVIHNLGPKACYLLAALAGGSVLWSVIAGQLEEIKLTSEDISAIWKKFALQKEACFLSVLMLGVTIGLVATGLFSHSPRTNVIVSVILAVIVLVSFSLVLSPVIAKLNAFCIIQSILSFPLTGATYYFFTDTAEQYPEGPHFSEFFYNSVLGGVVGVVSLLGIFSYQRYFSHWSYRSLLVTTNILLSLLHLLDIVLFTRTNLRIGLPDRVFVLGASALTVVVGQWFWMPQVVMLAGLCPKGMEASMYALLAGCHNFGMIVAANCGALLLDYLEVRPRGSPGESAQFDNLWKASLTSSVMPMVTVLLLFWLIPATSQRENLIGSGEDEATTGSWWRHWFPREAARAEP